MLLKSAEAVCRGFTDRPGRVIEARAENGKASIRPVALSGQEGKGFDDASASLIVIACKELVDPLIKIEIEARRKGELSSARPSGGYRLARNHQAQHVCDLEVVTRVDSPIEESLNAPRSQKPVIHDIDTRMEQIESGVEVDVEHR